ncbi:GNAT family N-acetyltransferase [Roseibium sp.]|uniref:GNAT family N-acetyltransferase n=1 Tax=Roseibium sp. TaxID=1936156 RepID=UPI003A980BD3
MAAPLARRKLGLVTSAATAWATEYGPLGAPLLSPNSSPAVIADFLTHVRRTSGDAVLAFPFVPLDGPAAAALTTAPGWDVVCEGEEARACHAGGAEGEEQFAMAFRGKRRKEMTRLRRRLEEVGPVQFASHHGMDAVHQFENFLQLEASGWKGKRGTALLSHHNSAAFTRGMVAERAAEDGVRIDSITVGGKPIAMLTVLIEGARAFSWKIAFDEDYARYSPGTQITLFAFERNLSDPRITGADSLAIPGHPMIDPLWRGRMRYGTLLCANSVRGRVLRRISKADMAAESRLRKMARKLLRRG